MVVESDQIWIDRMIFAFYLSQRHKSTKKFFAALRFCEKFL